jgi:hypothetical protein
MLRRTQYLALAVLAAWCGTARAHGGQFLLAGAAGLAAVVGAAFGALAAFRSAGQFPTLGHAALCFLVAGAVVAGVAAGSIEGSVLFVVFGGLGGAIPFVAGYFGLRAVLQWLRRVVVEHKRA